MIGRAREERFRAHFSSVSCSAIARASSARSCQCFGSLMGILGMDVICISWSMAAALTQINEYPHRDKFMV
jgi:hypothetical protein